MFTLIAIGTGAAYLLSLGALFAPQLFPASMRDPHSGLVAAYFESAAVITTLVLLGQLLELRARSQTSSAIKELLRLAPETATIIHDDGSDEVIDLRHAQDPVVVDQAPIQRPTYSYSWLDDRTIAYTPDRHALRVRPNL